METLFIGVLAIIGANFTAAACTGALLYRRSYRCPRFHKHLHQICGQMQGRRFAVDTISQTGMKIVFTDHARLPQSFLHADDCASFHSSEEQQVTIFRNFQIVKSQNLRPNELIIQFLQPLSKDEVLGLLGSGIERYILQSRPAA